jgi:hypothetical protein
MMKVKKGFWQRKMMMDMSHCHFHCPREGGAEQRNTYQGYGMMKIERIQRDSFRLDCASEMCTSSGRLCAGYILYRQGTFIIIGTTLIELLSGVWRRRKISTIVSST